MKYQIFRKRLKKVVVTLKHGTGLDEQTRPTPDIVEEIQVLPGQSFHSHIGYDELREHGQPVRTFNWKAGYTVEIEYFYQ